MSYKIGEEGWQEKYAADQDEQLRAECTNPRINWNLQSPVHGNWAEWKKYIGPMTRGIWYTLTDDQKFALAKDALEQSMRDYDGM